MNKSLFLFFFIIVSAIFHGCTEKEEPDRISINDDSVGYFQNTIDFSSKEGLKILNFSVNKDWEVYVSESSIDEDWCEIFPKSGPAGDVKLTLSTKENLSYEDRSIILTLKAGSIKKTIHICQKQNEALFLSSPVNNIISYKEQMLEIKFITNAELRIESNSEWIEYHPTRGLDEASMLLFINQNNSLERRYGEVTVRGDSFEQIYYIEQYGKPVDLSCNGTANSYIVPLKDAYFSLDASVAGNDREYRIQGGTKADLVWDSSNEYSNNSLIDSIEYDYENRRISFRAKQIEGNALIALYDNSDNIIWSWHLWLTDYDPDENFITFSNGTILMDRYLGATSEEGIGLYYQWGRKDPFASRKYNYYRASGDPITVEYCNSNPNVFIGGGYESTNWDWNTEHTAFWSSTKSVYDPCPPGWKVMDGEGIPSLSEGCFADENSNCFIIGEPNCTPQTKFRSTGLLHSAGHIQGTSDHISIWSNIGSYHGFYTALEKNLSFYQNDTNFKDSYDGRAYGLCIRCQRE